MRTFSKNQPFIEVHIDTVILNLHDGERLHYLVYENGGFSAGSGGTSFVAPQLNGIFTLIAQGTGSRLGLLQPQLYSAFKVQGYGAGSPFRPITAGTDFFYPSTANFNPATGLGSLNVTNLARALGVSL
ncbi:MAG TPA: hypothetical protein VFG03_08360 [Telluria sp.]|nr:hypothetical protein [Telluria sp.]